MKHGETIAQMQKLFLHLINRLNFLCDHISNSIATKKVLRCLTRNWKLKVTVIKEANNLATLDLTALFRKQKEHEQELNCLDKHEKKLEKKKKENWVVKE